MPYMISSLPMVCMYICMYYLFICIGLTNYSAKFPVVFLIWPPQFFSTVTE